MSKKSANFGTCWRPGARGNDEIELMAELISLPNSAASLNLIPQRIREMLLDALLHQLEVLAQKGHVLMVFEDAHWVDPSSRELLDLTIDRVARIPVLLVMTPIRARPVGCYSVAVWHRNPPISSSTRWCRTPPAARCCAQEDRHCTHVWATP